MHWTQVCIFIALLTLSCIRSDLFYANTLLLFWDRGDAASLQSSSFLNRCAALKAKTGHPRDFHQRSRSDRFVEGTKPVLIKGANIWTGEKNGTEIINGDILLDKGIIQGVGRSTATALAACTGEIIVIDANSAWVTPGLIDIRSHHGILSSPQLDGARDESSSRGTIQPWLRTIDALNTHDDAYPLSIAGGTTTTLVLPGSTDGIGGEGYVVKLRDTSEHSPTSMLLEPGSQVKTRTINDGYSGWRYIIHACGEDPHNMYNTSRMDNMWALRYAYTQAKEVVRLQDEYCSKVPMDGDFTDDFPEDYDWELLMDVLRGKVKVHIHCNEAVDLDGVVRLSQEFHFPIAVIHSGSDAYLVPEVLQRAYGQSPALALSSNSRKQHEKYRASEFAPRILADRNFTVLIQSYSPQGIHGRYLLYEAQRAFFYGLPPNLAITSVTSMPAEAMGMGHRIGYIKQGWDADLVMWDSHPLALGATPSQVFIDGIPQLSTQRTHKPEKFQKLPEVPNFDKEAQDALDYDGLPPLYPKKVSKTVVFTNITSIYNTSQAVGVERLLLADHNGPLAVVISPSGKFRCIGSYELCLISDLLDEASIIDLHGGSISPAFVSFGSSLGLQEIYAEASTNDGIAVDPLAGPIPKVIGGDASIVHALDGLEFGTRDSLLAYRAGVTSAISAPSHRGFSAGLSVQFSTGALHRLERGAIKEDTVALHFSIRHVPNLSIGTQIGALRRLFFEPPKGAIGYWFGQVIEGAIPLVIEAHSADVIATLVILKKEVELENKKTIQMTITGAAEAHMLASELAEARIGIILTPSRPYPKNWERRRILPGPPLTPKSAIATLLSHGVMLGLGVEEISLARDLPFDVAWASIEAGGNMKKEQALALGSTNIKQLLGIQTTKAEMVVTQNGDLLDFGSRVVGIISAEQGLVHLTL
ncbi:hypothetical protein AX15_002823 [Amanita polypyramis BW_CC]|nr:hypothetical protein AX15_002823 [Amanita polypyramis BW_CC]